jgi:DNA-binding GntR family transcriptional regulator
MSDNAGRSVPRQATAIAAPLRKQVIELLREAIFSFVYQPGERLVERDLCDRFGVSRTVVREALRHLEAEGLIDIVPNRGPVVFSITREDVRALYEVREVLEALAAQRCAELATSAQRRRLATALKRIENAYESQRLAEQVAAKDAFYTILFAACGNSIVESTLRTLHARAHMLRGLSLQVPGRREASLSELRRLVGAITRGDSEAARVIGAEHVRNAGRAALLKLPEVADEERAAATS